MNNQGASNDNIHLGDTRVFGDLEVAEDIKIDGTVVIDPASCLKTDCIQPATASGPIEIKTTGGNGIATFYDDQTIGALTLFGSSGGLTLASDAGGQAVMQIDQGTGIPTAGVRILNGTKLNVNEIQSQSYDTGANPKILFTASKVEIKGDTAIDFETKSILTTEIKKDTSGGNMIVKAADDTQILRTDDSLKEVYVGEDADGYRMPKLRGTIGQVLTQSNTGVATFEDLPQTGTNTLIGSVIVPRATYGAGNWANIATSFSGTTSIAGSTWAIGDVFRIKISGTSDHVGGTGGTAFLRFKVGALLTATSNDIYPTSNSNSTNDPFEIYICLTRTGTNSINYVGTGFYLDHGSLTIKEINFGRGTIGSYDPAVTYGIDVEYQDNSTSGTGNAHLYYICNSGLWTQSTPSSVIPVISTTDHTALNNLELGDAGHSQFALLAGRSGGQVLDGGVIATESIQFRSNAVQPTDAIAFLSPVDMKFNDIINVSDMEVSGIMTVNSPIIANSGIDTSTDPGSELSIASVNADKLNLGAAGITTEVKGLTYTPDRIQVRGPNTATKTSLLTLNNDTPTTCHILMSGAGMYGGDASINDGLCFSMDNNGTNDRRLLIHDSAQAINGTNPAVRMVLALGKAAIGAISTDRVTPLPLYLDATGFAPFFNNGGDLGSATNNWKDLYMNGDFKINGLIDSGDAGTLAIAPSNATKLDLGASGITTEVKGDLLYENACIEQYLTTGITKPTTLTSGTINTPIILNLDTDMITSTSNILTGSTAGVVTYTGSRSRTIHAALSIGFYCSKKCKVHIWAVSSNTTRYPLGIVDDGITFPAGTIPASILSIDYDQNTPSNNISTSSHFFVKVDTNDNFRVYVVSNAATTTITTDHLNIFALGMPLTTV